MTRTEQFRAALDTLLDEYSDLPKITLLALTALMMVGCDWNSDYEVNTDKDGILYGVIVIDSCEYIRGSQRLAHKGNCRFCKERRQKELEELVTKLKEK